jgi:hypothetical protein
VARAKRTDRAEARRRYRAQMAAEGGDELDPDEDAEPAAESRGPVSTPPRRGAAAPPPAPGRPGIGNAFRAAFRPANVREDLALLPQIVRHRSVWLPVLITIGTTAVLLATGGSDGISILVANYFVAAPPIGAIFLSGFLASRASYLTGAIAGLAGAICVALLIGVSSNGALGLGSPAASPSPSAIMSPPASASLAPSASAPSSAGASPSSAPSAAGSPQVSPTPSAGPTVLTPKERADTITAAFIVSPVTGVFFGAAAAWYRRFLNLANPNRAARRQQQTKGNPRRR